MSNVEIIEAKHLNCKTNHRIKPILVRFKDNASKVSILKRAKELSYKSGFENVAIGSSY